MSSAPSPLPSTSPEDRTLSPFTGYTRAHWEAAADGLLHAAWKWATPGRALLDLPGRPSGSGVRSDGLEGYARTFLAAAFRVAGAGGDDPHGWLERYADGLAAGTRTPGRDDTESWPLIRDHTVFGQPMVESASVALGLRLTRPWLWDRLDATTQDRAEEWLRGSLRHTPAPNNWYLFPYTVAGFLESVGRGDAATARARARAFDLLEGWYRGDGWYADGDGRAFDHYNGWALHLYPVLDAHLCGDGEPLAHYGGRLREHLESFSLMFGADGAPLHFGRSLAYRFAAGAAVGMGAVSGHTPLSPGASRRLVSGSLRYFLERGATGEDGVLSLGWHGPHTATLQRYSGPAVAVLGVEGVRGAARPGGPPAVDGSGGGRPERRSRPGAVAAGAGAAGPVDPVGRDRPAAQPRQRPCPAARGRVGGRGGPALRAVRVLHGHRSLVGGERRGQPPLRQRRMGPGASAAGSIRWAPGTGTAGAGRPPGTCRSSRGSHAAVPGLRVESVTFVRGRHELRVHRVLGAPAGTRLEQTGWATAPGASPHSTLHGLHGWESREEVRAPQGTAYTRWAVLPRLAADAEGTAVLVALASLTGETDPACGDRGGERGGRASTGDAGAGDTVEVVWSEDGALTRIAFGPRAPAAAPVSVSVEHGTR